MKQQITLSKAKSNIEGGVMKNRPFSSENKYGNMRRYNPNMNISQKYQDDDPQQPNPYNNIDMMESSIDEKALSERKSSKGFILPPIARINQEIKNLITEDVDNDGQLVEIDLKNETQLFSRNDDE